MSGPQAAARTRRRTVVAPPGARRLSLPLSAFVAGSVGTKGSFDVFAPGQVAESVSQDWRKAVQSTLLLQLGAAESPRGLVPTWLPFEQPLAVLCCFDIAHPGNTKFTEPIRQMDGDTDKMLRVIGDALQHIRVIKNDSIITIQLGFKRWVPENEPPGMRLMIADPSMVEVRVAGVSWVSSRLTT